MKHIKSYSELHINESFLLEAERFFDKIESQERLEMRKNILSGLEKEEIDPNEWAKKVSRLNKKEIITEVIRILKGKKNIKGKDILDTLSKVVATWGVVNIPVSILFLFKPIRDFVGVYFQSLSTISIFLQAIVALISFTARIISLKGGLDNIDTKIQIDFIKKSGIMVTKFNIQDFESKYSKKNYIPNILYNNLVIACKKYNKAKFGKEFVEPYTKDGIWFGPTERTEVSGKSDTYPWSRSEREKLDQMHLIFFGFKPLKLFKWLENFKIFLGQININGKIDTLYGNNARHYLDDHITRRTLGDDITAHEEPPSSSEIIDADSGHFIYDINDHLSKVKPLLDKLKSLEL